MREAGLGTGVFLETFESFEEQQPCLREKDSDSCETQGDLRAVSCEFRTWVEEYLQKGLVSDGDCLEVLEKGLRNLTVAKRPLIRGQGHAVLLGLYGVGGFKGISRAATENLEVTRYLNQFVRAQNPDHVWTTLYVTRNTAMPIHRDLRNAKGFNILVRAVGDFVGGGLWVEGDRNQGPVGKEVPGGFRKFGRVFDVRSEPAVFSGERWHVAEDWVGTSRWVISAFTPMGVSDVTIPQWDTLRDLGFPVDKVKEQLEQGLSLKTCFTEDAESYPVVTSEAEWVVGLPLPIVDDELVEGLEGLHQSVARQCKLLEGELCEFLDATEEVLEITRQLNQAECYSEWLEQCLSLSREGSEVTVRALQSEVPLNSEEPLQDQFLQTRTVGLAEARKELTLWKESAQDEVYSLETTNRAVDRISVKEVDRWAAEGINVVQLPGKVVLTRKSGTGKRRCRAVCCGNYLPTEKLGLMKDDLYASGAESLSVKVALTFAAGRSGWTGVTIDVKSAFLYAPIRSESQGSEERIVVKPPNFLVELGILDKNDRWWIRKALYGLPTSPRDWGRYRDQEFRNFHLRWNDADYHLVQTISDDALWVARKVTDLGYGEIEGILVVYVDDLLFLAPMGLGEAFVAAVQERWKTSTPEWLSGRPLTFCGMELSRLSSGYRMCQTAYVRELLGRYCIEESASTPITRWLEPELSSPPSVEEVREAQAITGALLWLSTRTRPDLSYVVSRCGQQATKCPSLAVSLGRQALAYLKDTIEVGIDVPFEVGSSFSDHGLLSLPRSERVLELYSDASHSPQGERSMQSIFILWKGVPLTWEASRQPFDTLSSAEAELVCMVHGVQVAEAVVPLVQELVENDVVVSLLGDNEAAIRAFGATPSGWRNRHLRMRALAARERVSANLLKVAHLPGQFQIADLGTKPLPRVRIMQLLELANVRCREDISEPARSARVHSRLGLPKLLEGAELAEALAGLALLAALPQVKGQPSGDQLEVGAGWLAWVLGAMITGVAFCWGWWWIHGTAGFQWIEVFWGCAVGDSDGFGNEPGLEAQAEVAAEKSPAESFGEPQLGSSVNEPPESESAVESSAPGEAVARDVPEGAGDEFTEEEWEQARAKFRSMELDTGLTFVQRARLRRALAAGGVIEVPVFQQRYGPLPSWMMGPDVSPTVDPKGGVSASGCFDLAKFLEDHALQMMGLLGHASPEVVWIQVLAVSFQRSPQIRMIGRFRDSGAQSVLPSVGRGRVVFQFNQVEHENVWTPVEMIMNSGVQVSSFQIGGSTEHQNSLDSQVQIGGSTDHQNSLDSQVQIGGSTDQNSLDSQVQIGGSTEPQNFWDSQAQIGESTGYQNHPSPVVQYGGSASSTDPCPSVGPVAQVGGSSSSHGFANPQDSWGFCYEDIVAPLEDCEGFPMVGTWTRLHFLASLLSSHGEIILWFLGYRSQAWRLLRVVSMGVRYAMTGSIGEVLKRGPYFVMFSGPQWCDAVEEFILTGYPVGEDEPSAEAVEPLFPLVVWVWVYMFIIYGEF